MARPETYRTASDTARRLGLTVRALRVYERHGLLRPGRTLAGWRVYGPEEMAQLHQVLALKRLGLKLGQIADLLKGRRVDLDRVLALQEDELSRRKARVDHALELVRKARARLAEGHDLPTEDLIELTKETVVSEFKWTPEHQALAEKHYTPEQLAELEARKHRFTPEDQERVSQAWREVFAEAERLKDGDPGSPQALDLARRWRALVAEFTRQDPALMKAASGFTKELRSRLDLAQPWTTNKDVWAFAGAALERLKVAEQG
jgi:DNA-binding transcriptional MerR regulator